MRPLGDLATQLQRLSVLGLESFFIPRTFAGRDALDVSRDFFHLCEQVHCLTPARRAFTPAASRRLDWNRRHFPI